MKKRLLSILMCLCMVCALLPTAALAASAVSVYVGEVELRSGQYTTDGVAGVDLNGTPGGGSYAYFDTSSGAATLTLHNFTYSGAGTNDAAIYAAGDLSLVLEGASSLTKTGSGSNSYGVYCDAGLTISGLGSLSATSADGGSGESCGIKGAAVSITGGTMVATGGSASNSYGIKGVAAISASAQVTATGGAAINSSYGIFGSDDLTIDGNAQVTATGGAATDSSYCSSYGIYGVRAVAVSGGTVVATSGSATNSSGIGGNKISISSGEVVAAGGAATGKNCSSYGIHGSSSGVVVSGGTVVATGGTATGSGGSSYGICSNTGITISDGVTVARAGMTGVTPSFNGENRYAVYCRATDGLRLTADGKTAQIAGAVGRNGDFGELTDPKPITVATDAVAIGSETTAATGVVIVPAGVEIIYNGGCMNSEYSNDKVFLSVDEKPAFTPTGSLTISDDTTLVAVSLYEGATNPYGIESTVDLTITNNGILLAVGGMNDGTGQESCGIKLYNVSLTLSGSGATVAVGGMAGSSSYGISVGIGDPTNGIITISGSADVTATGGAAGTLSYGIYGDAVRISDGRVTATGGTSTTSHGIVGVSVKITGGSVAATGGTAESSYGITGTEIDLSGRVAAIGGAANNSYGVARNSITVSGGSGVAVGGTKAMFTTPKAKNGYALLDGAMNTDKIAGWGLADMTVTLSDTSTCGYTDFEQGWSMAAENSGCTVRLYADWIAAADGGSTSFGTGTGFGAQGDTNNLGCIVVPTGKSITLDLNGHTIDRGLSGHADGVLYGYVINVAGKLTIEDSSSADVTKQGKITGGNNSYRIESVGAIRISSGGLIMKGGNITGNQTKNWASAVRIMTGFFEISGGKISGNRLTGNDEDTNDGANGAVSLINSSASFTMTGGEISDNIGGGVSYASQGAGSFETTLGRTAKITGNTRLDNTTPCNIYLNGNKITLATGADVLAEGAEIGISSKTAPTAGVPVDITATPDADYSAYFTSDSDLYTVGKKSESDSSLQLKTAESLVTFGAHENGAGFTAEYGEGTAIGSDTRVASGSIVTVTPGAADSGYSFYRIIVTKTGDESKPVAVSNRKFTMPAFPVTITVEYETDEVPVTPDPNGEYTPPMVTEIKTGGSTTADNLSRLISGGQLLTVTGADGARLVFGTNALKGVAGRTAGSVTVSIEDVSGAYQDSHPGKRVFSLTVESGGQNVTDFGGSVTVTLPYALKDGEKAEDVSVWYLAGDGTMTELPCAYDAKTGLATFTVTHFSEYAVGVSEWVNSFKDVKAGDWFYSAVEYADRNGLFEGTSETTFSPNDPMTRQMLWTVLGRLDGQTLTGSGMFDRARTWAMEKGITDGSRPEEILTREQLVTILWRYAGSPMLADYPGLSTFADAGDIASYAQQAMAWAHQRGIISGAGAAMLSPRVAATRAQVAAVLMRYAQSAVK